MKYLNSPAAKGRFLLLPLIIPVVFSPALHLIFPWLEHFAIIVQIETAFPFLVNIRSYESYVAPFLVAAFLLILTYNLLTGFAVTLREVRSNSQTRLFANVNGQKTLNGLASEFALSAPLLTISTRHPEAAYICGWKYPIVTLGSKWIHQLDPEEIEAVFAHELAHFKRGDNWQMLIAKTCRDLMFFNPLAHHIYTKYIEACEQAADDLAIQITQKPLALASSLVKSWRMQQPITLSRIGANLIAQPAQLEKRILRLMNYEIDNHGIISNNALFYCISIALIIVLSLV